MITHTLLGTEIGPVIWAQALSVFEAEVNSTSDLRCTNTQFVCRLVSNGHDIYDLIVS